MNSRTSNVEPESNSESAPSWRSEVESRLNSYRAKRQRNLSGQFSMRFDVDGQPAAPRESICGVRAAAVPVDAPAAPMEEASENQPEIASANCPLPGETKLGVTEQYHATVETPVIAAPSPRPSVPFRRKIVIDANVIEFPRLFPMEPAGSSLAEPVSFTPPRILDAPEIAEPLIENPILEGMRLEGLPSEMPASPLETPVQAAVLTQRVYAGLFDGLLAVAGGALSLTIAYKVCGTPEISKVVAATALALQTLFWWLYQYLFLVYGGRTPGMRIARVALRTFAGQVPTKRERQKRVFGLLLSCASLALGFLWAIFDEDGLCWHDRISGTYGAEQKI